MANERLGIFENEQRKRQQFARFIEHRVMPVEASPVFQKKVEKLTNKALDAEVARLVAAGTAARIAHDTMPLPVLTGPSVKTILETVSAVTGHTVEQICGPWRHAPLARARFFACWLMSRTRPDLSLAAIARPMGRHHTSSLHAIRSFEKRKDKPPISDWLADERVVALMQREAPKEEAQHG